MSCGKAEAMEGLVMSCDIDEAMGLRMSCDLGEATEGLENEQ